MSKDYQILEKIQNETSLERLKTLFIHTLHQHEAELVQIHESHENEVTLLQQQLSDSDAAVNGLKIQMQKLKEIQENELDMMRVNELQLQDNLKKTKRENSILREKLNNSSLLSMQNSNSTEDLKLDASKLKQKLSIATANNKILLNQLNDIRKELNLMGSFNQKLREDTIKFIDKSNDFMFVLKEISARSVKSSSDAYDKLDKVMNGLVVLKNKINVIQRTPVEIQKPNFEAMRLSLERRVSQMILISQQSYKSEMDAERQEYIDALALKAEEAKALITKARNLIIGVGSVFRLFMQQHRGNINVLRQACMHSVNTVGFQINSVREKERKKLKTVRQELKLARHEIELLEQARDIQREKMRELKASSANSSASSSPRIKKRSVKSSISRLSSSTGVPDISSISKPGRGSLVSVGVTAHLMTPNIEQMRERSRRITRESEVNALEAEVKRKDERISQMEGQIAGLRRIIKRNGEANEEESGRTRQNISDLEAQLRDERKAAQRKVALVTKLQRDLEESRRVAARVDPLSLAMSRIFKSASDQLAPLIAEQSISEDLTELDQLAQEFFNVPIHKICAPSYSRNYLKKQEHRFNTAMQNMEVDEIVKVFDSLLEELKKRAMGPKP